ncbi:hypothetical protein OBBRIDRAFT_823403 [Obba rivulosa]|uniref:Uncharacterized protein n=1 Tax=Obba rivulosa TaxID=1052685 RepID=A0A8E2J6W4_9APHY|nr:hypothetical protein OBBRIDRAFT_823403 [Obba rivulosa]
MARIEDVYIDEMLRLGLGYPLWHPSPTESGEVQVGDVGYIRDDKFIRLFNATKDPYDPANSGLQMPQNFERLVLPDDAICRDTFAAGMRCSPTVTATPIPTEDSEPSGLPRKYAVEADGYGAMLYLDEDAERYEVGEQFALPMTRYMLQNFPFWQQLANEELHLALNSSDIVFVRGCVKAKVWTTVTFAKEYHPYVGTMSFEYGPEWTTKSTLWTDEGEIRPVVESGPQILGDYESHRSISTDDPSMILNHESVYYGHPSMILNHESVYYGLPPLEDQEPTPHDRPPSNHASLSYDPPLSQCVFLSFYKMKHRRLIGPKVIKAAAGPRNDGRRGSRDHDPEGLAQIADDRQIEIESDVSTSEPLAKLSVRISRAAFPVKATFADAHSVRQLYVRSFQDMFGNRIDPSRQRYPSKRAI